MALELEVPQAGRIGTLRVLCVAKWVDASIDCPLRSGVCLGIGQIAVEDLGVEVQEAWRPVLLKWCEEDADPGTHSAADWILRQWQVPLPEIATSGDPINGRQWYINSLRMTMLRIPEGRFVRTDNDEGRILPGAKAQEVTMTLPYFLSDREVSVGLFQRFVDDDDYEHEKPTEWPGADSSISPTPSHPVQQVSWYDAVKFCNWLSRREGRMPCYKYQGESTRQIVRGKGKEELWELIAAADGYRLPTEGELEHACRAGTETNGTSAYGARTYGEATDFGGGADRSRKDVY